MFDDNNIVYVIIRKTIVYSLIVIGIMFIGIKDSKPYVLGYIFGTTISILGFKLIEKTSKRAVTMKPSKAYNYSILHYFIRYFIYAIVLIVAAIADYLNFFTTAFGLFMIKIAIVTSAIYSNKRKKNNKD
ncbi:ATP synthase subunit I [Schnuerera sp.]|uniref:ATP synthase subunit I n=1 Tax=Schnuerera sp. TaxID=2794844 RepID=UPI002C9991FA|nr:ATP synthase subunit I [Schnuerera sp.]HSH35886.1 ATP synthase subunit I [Schnuerera sp.]